MKILSAEIFFKMPEGENREMTNYHFNLEGCVQGDYLILLTE